MHLISCKVRFQFLHTSLWLACLPLTLSACGFVEYFAKPIDQQALIHKIESKHPDNAEFKQYLADNNYTPSTFPIKQWNLDELIYCALFFHPNLDLARAQWRAAEAAQTTAGARPLPTLSGNYGKSDNVNGDISPYTYGLSIDIPVITANKLHIRIENAQHLSEAAKLDVAQTAWSLRAQVATTYYELQFNQAQIRALSQELAYRQDIVAVYQKRQDLGLASKVELSHAKLLLQTTNTDLNTQQQNKLVLTTKLASNLGLPLSLVQQMTFAETHSAESIIENAPSDLLANAQSAALLNRLDLRAALERYAVAEGKLKLEIAKQYPDLTFSPSYTYEFGSQVWSLGLSGLMTILNKNKYAIAEATQLREVEAAQFEALQSRVISETHAARAKLTQTQQSLADYKRLYALQQDNTNRMQHLFAGGEIDRLELTMAKLEDLMSEKSVLLANFQLYSSINNLENTLQHPLHELGNQPNALNAVRTD
ncbi:TolC family protein [Methylotenera mobilis]|uniref:Outer membrane efflux protein n=1 Tax=Methylotenera mobilis (strain JLW8 / ATCC BAA-1282 / DSM 17540) TaxID=583345 RepID=C6WWD5_METML|nr:TolC family protein [Methylotenera mobilis]ACT48234.1 outer membrane efflux protein [Methylotenera mobilis JLW8]